MKIARRVLLAGAFGLALVGCRSPLAAERARIEEARTALAAGDYAAARAKAAETTHALLARPAPQRDREWLELLDAAGLAAWDAQDSPTARAAWEQVLEVRSRTLPPDHADLGLVRMRVALTLFDEGDLSGARALQERVLEVFERTLPPDHPSLQALRNALANTLSDLGELSTARDLYEQVLEVYSRTLPPDHGDLQSVRGNLAVTLSVLGDLPAAHALQVQALEAFLRTLPPEHPNVQLSRMNLAVTVGALGDLDAARELQEQVLDVLSRTLPPEHPNLQRARNSLAMTRFDQGDIAGARGLYEQALESLSRTLPPEHQDLQAVRLNLANALRVLGDLPAARAIEEQELEIRSRILPPEHPNLQKARLNLAATLAVLGDLSAARAMYEQALEVASRSLPPEHQDLQTARFGLAYVLVVQGDLAAARPLQEQVVEVFARTLPPEHALLQRARMSLACTLHEQEDHAAARTVLEEVVEVLSRTLPPGHPDLLMARGNLASTLHAQGDLAASRELYEEVLESCTAALPPDHPDLQTARVGLIDVVLSEAAARRGDEKERWNGTAREHAIASARSATSVALSAMLSSSEREAEERCSSLQELLSRSISYAGGCGVLAPDPDLLRAAFVLSETTRASALVSARISRMARSDERCAALREEITTAGEELARLVQSGATREEYDAVISARDRGQGELVRLASRSEKAARLLDEPESATLSDRLPDDAAVVAYRRYTRSLIPPGQTQARSTESLCAFVLHKGAPLHFVELGAIEPIERAARDWRHALGTAEGRGVGAAISVGNAGDASRYARELGALVLEPLLPSLGGAHRLVVLLDDVLHSVPIDALPLPEEPGTSLLGDRFAVELRSSVQELSSDSAAPSGEGRVLVLGGADYEGEPVIRGEASAAAARLQAAAPRSPSVPGLLRGGAWSEGFAPLPGAAAEARGVADLASRRRTPGSILLLEEAEASRGSIARLAPTVHFLHLATHGWFAPESVRSWSDPGASGEGDRWSPIASPEPSARLNAQERVRGSSPMLLCGLALAGANLPADSIGRYPGIVTAAEISDWDLGGCELAVLSACDTNVGERRAGQGVASLQKALHMAGSRTVVASLWKVPDEATKDLMLEFYRRIWFDQEPKAHALWQAKKRLRDARDESGRARYATRDWAGWVLTGDPR